MSSLAMYMIVANATASLSSYSIIHSETTLSSTTHSQLQMLKTTYCGKKLLIFKVQ